MAKRRKGKDYNGSKTESRLHPDVRKSIWAVSLIGIALLLFLSEIGKAGPAGKSIYGFFKLLLGMGYFILPISFVSAAIALLISERRKIVGVTLSGTLLLILSVLGMIDIISPKNGGLLGFVFGALRYPFGNIASFIINSVIFAIGLIMILNIPIRLRRRKGDVNIRVKKGGKIVELEEKPESEYEEVSEEGDSGKTPEEESASELGIKGTASKIMPKLRKPVQPKFKDYIPPPLDILRSDSEKPTTGDLRANANIIKRTLDSFGIPVEMGEINIGPKVTRYTLKPAEGIKLSRIISLNQDLALALAAHPIRIEAPIPGKSLVGIEVPNKSAALVRLRNLMAYPDFQQSGSLGFALGRDVTGEPIFINIANMPHLLIAGSTGSGKSVCIHSLIISLLYKNSPSNMRLVLIDPKRVELGLYKNLPHLVSDVITDNKKAASVFRWAISEMEKRYEILQSAGARDIESYNSLNKDDRLPYILVIVDELADIMASYGREVEGSVVRLAQMARATGIHLILSTQRPSVEVITGLIKANITSRIALQVASQIDSRTILDASGAEKLLGGGDLLFISPRFSKPKRVQGVYVSESEVKKVVDFIIKNNNYSAYGDENAGIVGNNGGGFEAIGANNNIFEDYNSDDEDELYDEAVDVVRRSKKASASLLQRRLRIGYARAARLLDIMEEKGVIGPANGAKPREVYIIDKEEQNGAF